jgi:hypothetical protein
MPIACRHKAERGAAQCENECPATVPCGVFRYHRIEKADQIPEPDERAVDVAILDMNHGWPNLGHDSLVHAVLESSCDLVPLFEATGLHVRALSYEVRRGHLIPEPPGGRFAVYVGTGGPGHIDPYRNDGIEEGTQGVEEDPAWQAPLFGLYDSILADEGAALLSVCHSFGVMCRWSGVAQPALRGPEKGGKSTGILENMLAPEALMHPWFRHFSEELPEGRRLRVVENRLYDLLPVAEEFPDWVLPIGYETLGIGGPRGNAVTMLEFARDSEGLMPRVFGVNHHPEIVDRSRQKLILNRKRERREVTDQWYAERLDILTRTYPDENSDQRLHVTSDYTLLAPLRFYLHRAVRQRAEALGFDTDLHEDQVAEGAGVL